jgi:ferredoxin
VNAGRRLIQEEGPVRITIDRDECIACGACYAECPDVFEENKDDGLSQITQPYREGGSLAAGEVPKDLKACARAGADICPVSIIHVG